MAVFPSQASGLSFIEFVTDAVAVTLVSAFISIANSIRLKTHAAKLLTPVTGPTGTFLLGFIPELTKNIHRIFDFQHRVFTLAWFNDLTILFMCDLPIWTDDPADVEYVLSTNMNNYVKSDHFITPVNEVFGKALLGLNHAHTADGGAMCRFQRKVFVRAFTTTSFKAFSERIFHKHAMNIVDNITTQGGKCNMHTISRQYTLQTTFDIVCGAPLESIDNELGLKFIESMDFIFATISVRVVWKPYFKCFWSI